MRVVSLILVFLIGLAGGWLLRDGMEAEETPGSSTAAPARISELSSRPDVKALLEAGQYSEVVAMLDGDTRRLAELAGQMPLDAGLNLLRTFNEAHGEQFDTVMTMATLQANHGNYQASVDLLLRAFLLVDNEAQETRLEHKLDTITGAYARELVADKRLERLDGLYEMIVLALPEQAEYYLKLGRLRMRMGDFERALVPLSHIENDRQWGEQARELIARAEASEVLPGPGHEKLALRREGSQFVVKAVIDHGSSANLLIDTGAAMTIIDADVLTRLGYSLNDQPREYFSTANGVVEAPVVSVRHLGVGNTGIRGLPVGALPLGLPKGIEGLLGMNFFRHYEFRIDQNGNTLHLDSDH